MIDIALELKLSTGVVKLSTEEAKELYGVLHSLFGKPIPDYPIPPVQPGFPTWPWQPAPGPGISPVSPWSPWISPVSTGDKITVLPVTTSVVKYGANSNEYRCELSNTANAGSRYQ